MVDNIDGNRSKVSCVRVHNDNSLLFIETSESVFLKLFSFAVLGERLVRVTLCIGAI